MAAAAREGAAVFVLMLGAFAAAETGWTLGEVDGHCLRQTVRTELTTADLPQYRSPRLEILMGVC